MKKYNKIRLLFLVIVLIIVPVTAFAAPKNNVIYTALGDSIAYGTGGTVVETELGQDPIGYVDLLEKYLIKGNDKGICYDLSQIGMTSQVLLAALTISVLPEAIAARKAVADADIITISIGGNDILGPVKNIDITRINDPAYMLALKGQLMGYVQGFALNWAGIINSVRSPIKLNNQKAEVYVNTVYNPFKEGDPIYGFADDVITVLNSVITNPQLVESYGYQVVDVYTEFANYKNPVKALIHELDNPAAIHPTDTGYKIIYNIHKHLFNADEQKYF